MNDQVAKFIRIIDDADEELTIRTERDLGCITAKNRQGKLYYAIAINHQRATKLGCEHNPSQQ